MSTSAGIFKSCFVLLSCLLMGVALSPMPAHAIHGGSVCVFTLNIPKIDIYPIFKTCVGIFAKEARTEAQLMAQCSNASVWRIKERFKVKSPSNNRRWTTFEPESKSVIKSANCLPDVNGTGAGSIDCKDITIRENLTIDVNFGHKPLKL